MGQIVAERYEIESLLGSGGMGAVYRARHVHMRKTVALKVLHREMTHLSEVVARFEREAIAAAHIQHPHVAAATDFGRLETGSFYLVLEYVDGRSLRDVLAAEGKFSAERALRIARQVAEALEAAHAAGVVHRDLKPDNVMLVERGQDADFVKVLDFGIAKLSREETSSAPALTQLGSVFGTPEYMSPEQAMGSTVDHRSDLYSLGIILYEMVSGATPFATEDSIALLTRHMTQPPPPLGVEVPEALARSIMTLLGKRPDDRQASASALAAELATIEAGLAPPSSPASLSQPTPLSAAATSIALPLPIVPATTAIPAHTTSTTMAASQANPTGNSPVNALELLTRQLVVGQLRFPLWMALVAGGGAVFVGLFSILALSLLVSPGTSTAASSTPAQDGWSLPPLELGGEPPPTSPPVDRDRARKTVARIEELPVYKRTVEDWRALGAAHHDLEEYAKSVSAYRNAISKRRSLANNADILEDLRRAGRDEAAATQVITLCETFLLRSGGPGLDLLYRIWEDLRVDPQRLDLAERYLKKLEILSQRGSDATQVAIELYTKTSCSRLAEVVDRAASQADARSLERLRELERLSACQRPDCLPCLRSSDSLGRALRRAEKRPAPTLGKAD